MQIVFLLLAGLIGLALLNKALGAMRPSPTSLLDLAGQFLFWFAGFAWAFAHGFDVGLRAFRLKRIGLRFSARAKSHCYQNERAAERAAVIRDQARGSEAESWRTI